MKGYFIRRIIEDIREISKLDLNVEAINHDSFRVYREWKNIDLLAISKQEKLLIVFENKIRSGESEYQLSKYQTTVESEFGEFSKIYVYLTPYGETASDPDLRMSYDYIRILRIIDNLLRDYSKILDQDICTFISHYRDSLRRNIVKDKRLQELCLEIYHTHKEAFDFIMDNLPNQRSIYQTIIVEYLESRDDIIMDDSGKTLIRFIPKQLDTVIPKAVSKWTRTGRLFLFEIENFEQHVSLKSVVGPSLNNERDKLLGFMRECTDERLFKNINRCHSNRFSHVNAELIMDKSGYDIRNESEIREFLIEKMDKLFETFILDVIEYMKNYNK